MTRDKILNLLTKNREKLNGLKVNRLALFGSVVRGDNKPDSDVDVLVEFSVPMTLDLYIDLHEFLEELIGCKVDLVMKDGLKPRIKPHIEKDAIHIDLYNNTTV